MRASASESLRDLVSGMTPSQTGFAPGRRQNKSASDIDPEETATFIMAVYEGYVSLSKNLHDPKLMGSGHNSLIEYLESLRDTRTGK